MAAVVDFAVFAASFEDTTDPLPIYATNKADNREQISCFGLAPTPNLEQACPQPKLGGERHLGPKPELSSSIFGTDPRQTGGSKRWQIR